MDGSGWKGDFLDLKRDLQEGGISAKGLDQSQRGRTPGLFASILGREQGRHETTYEWFFSFSV